MRDRLWIKFISGLAIVAFTFVNFVSCGARNYKVSVREDHDPLRINPDALNPNSPTFGIHAINGWTQLPIKFRVSQELNNEQRAGLLRAMGTWEMAVGRKLFNFVGDDAQTGDGFPDLYSSLDDATNGYYLDNNWQKTGKSNIVLATTIWANDGQNTEVISSADIHFNSNYYLIGNSFTTVMPLDDPREIVDMETLALHELGHMLGLSHVEEENDPESIMNPSLYIGEGLANRHLSDGDIRRIQQIYECNEMACDAKDLRKALSAREKEGDTGRSDVVVSTDP